MLNQLLKQMYNLNIQIKEENKKIKLIYNTGLVSDDLKQAIIKHKKSLVERLAENEEAIEHGFFVYNHGELYEYRYGLGAFLYIERLPNGLADAWRANYAPNTDTPYKTVIVARNVPFAKAYEKAAGFITWLQDQKKGRRGA